MHVGDKKRDKNYISIDNIEHCKEVIITYQKQVEQWENAGNFGGGRILKEDGVLTGDDAMDFDRSRYYRYKTYQSNKFQCFTNNAVCLAGNRLVKISMTVCNNIKIWKTLKMCMMRG